jgi:hypothetical protein
VFVPVPAPPTTPGRQLGGVALSVGALVALGLSVWTWLTAGASLVESLNRGLSSQAPTTSAESPGGDFLVGAVGGTALWGVAIALACGGLAVGRGWVRVVGALVLTGVVGFVPLALGVVTVVGAVRG